MLFLRRGGWYLDSLKVDSGGGPYRINFFARDSRMSYLSSTLEGVPDGLFVRSEVKLSSITSSSDILLQSGIGTGKNMYAPITVKQKVAA